MPSGVYKRSPETRAKMSAWQLGRIPWNKGKTGIYSEETKEKLRKANVGKKHSEETKKKVGDASRGNKYALGNKLSDETRKKMSEARKNPTIEFRKKMSEVRRGEKGSNWKGGLTTKNQIIRSSLEYKLWRESVFKRDNFTCIWCGAKSGEGKAIMLNADHIKPFAYFPELRFAIDNGRTLCVPCHKTTDTYGGRYNGINSN